MLLPSPLTCDSSNPPPKTRYQSARFASPPPTPGSSSALTNIYSTCRALQSMLTTPNQLPSPPTVHADMPSSPFKLRLRQAVDSDTSAMKLTPRKKVAKRGPPRGLNKRRRTMEDEMDPGSREDEKEEENACEEGSHLPSTPKRMRLAPEVLPLGLERSDFHTLHRLVESDDRDGKRGDTGLERVEGGVHGEEDEGGAESWSTEEDRLLVELVLEKLKLSKSDWQDCARSLGKDRGSVGRRWKSLMGNGEVGLKGRPRRGRIHSTWR